MEKKPPDESLEDELGLLIIRGWQDLFQRPGRYHVLPGLMTAGSSGHFTDGGPRRARARVLRLLEQMTDDLTEPRISAACKALLGVDKPDRAQTHVDVRREAAAVRYFGSRRSPLTILKDYEPSWRRYMLEVLREMAVAPAEDDPVRMQTFTQNDLNSALEEVEDLLAKAETAVTEQRLHTADRYLGDVLDVPLRAGASEHESWLYARAFYLRGSVYRDQGRLSGRRTAWDDYAQAGSIYERLQRKRGHARTQLMQAVLLEMGGQLPAALHAYEARTSDSRLPELERQRAALWAGSTLTKLGEVEEARKRIIEALDYFEQNDSDVISGRLKLSANLRQSGQLDSAVDTLQAIPMTKISHRPLLVVRLSVAKAHALLSDEVTIAEGLALLGVAQDSAERQGYGHQLIRIKGLRGGAERGPLRRSTGRFSD